MDPQLVLRKTAKGREEIDKRTFRVDARRRMLLILIDGRSTAAEVAAKAAHVANPDEMFESLLVEGFVEPGDSPASPGTAGPVQRAPAADLLDAAKRRAVKSLEHLMGPGAEAIALKIERAATREDLLAEAQKAREALRSYLGARQAEEFWNSLQI
ncbi:MAG: hypothetical protein ABIQ72_09235 [Usitatibacter sp.]